MTELDNSFTLSSASTSEDNVEWKLNTFSKSPIYSDFLVQYINGKRTTLRKCLHCNRIVKSVNSGTSCMLNHKRKCTGMRIPTIQIAEVASSICNSVKREARLELAAKLVFQDDIPIHKLTSSSNFKELFAKSGCGKITAHALNGYINDVYQQKIEELKILFANFLREKCNIFVAFDEWFTVDKSRYLGIFVYIRNRRYCLGLIPYDEFPESPELTTQICERLSTFNLSIIDVMAVIGDSNNGIEEVAQMCNKPFIPCLANIINIIAKTLLLKTPNLQIESDENISDDLFMDDIVIVRKACRIIVMSSQLQENIEALQKNLIGEPILNIVLDNYTSWHSTYLMLKRFLALRKVLKPFYEELFLSELRWDVVSQVAECLQPLVECTLPLQKNSNLEVYLGVVQFLTNFYSNNKSVFSAIILSVFEQHVNSNELFLAITKESGEIYSSIKSCYEINNSTSVESSISSDTDSQASSSFYEFMKQQRVLTSFDIKRFLIDMPATSVDPERMFSYDQLSANFIDCKASFESYNRNCFLKFNY